MTVFPSLVEYSYNFIVWQVLNSRVLLFDFPSGNPVIFAIIWIRIASGTVELSKVKHKLQAFYETLSH